MRVEIPLQVASPECEKRENCALIGISATVPSTEIYSRLKNGLIALQHRGEEAAGVAFNNSGVEVYKDLGLVKTALPNEKLDNLPSSRVALGHTRYSTVQDKNNKEKEVENSQPFLFRIPYGEGVFFEFSIAHNGTVREPNIFAKEHGPNSDTYRIGQVIVEADGSFEDRVKQTLPKLDGAYMLLFVTSNDRLYVASDPWGFKPGVLGYFDGGAFEGIAFASETIALEKMGAKFFTYIERGLFAEIISNGLRRVWTDSRTNDFPEARCTFEKAYFADSASVINGERKPNHNLRKTLGRQLAERNYDQLIANGDVVVPVPDSGSSYADGVMERLNLPPSHGIQKTRYGGRTFIQPRALDERFKDVFAKFNFIPDEIEGKRLIIVDDSIVRGNTMRGIILTLFRHGAERIELLSGIPPVTHPCFWGIDFARPQELIYNQLEIAEGRVRAYEQELASWLVDHDPKLSQKINVYFQRFDDYVSIMQKVPHGIPPQESGGCFHCVSGIVPRGVTTP